MYMILHPNFSHLILYHKLCSQIFFKSMLKKTRVYRQTYAKILIVRKPFCDGRRGDQSFAKPPSLASAFWLLLSPVLAGEWECPGQPRSLCKAGKLSPKHQRGKKRASSGLKLAFSLTCLRNRLLTRSTTRTCKMRKRNYYCHQGFWDIAMDS